MLFRSFGRELIPRAIEAEFGARWRRAFDFGWLLPATVAITLAPASVQFDSSAAVWYGTSLLVLGTWAAMTTRHYGGHAVLLWIFYIVAVGVVLERSFAVPFGRSVLVGWLSSYFVLMLVNRALGPYFERTRRAKSNS